MAFYSSRLAYELELSRKIAVERELEYSRAFEIQKLAEAKQLQFKEIKEIQRLRQDQEFREYQLRKNAELAQAEENLLQERIYRQGKQRQYDAFVEAQKRSRIQREEQIEIQKRILEQEQRKKSEALAFSRRVEMERQIKAKEDINRQNTFVLQEQRTQQKLEKQLREIDLQIGSIHDGRDDRKKQELLELQKLDETIFKLRQQLRGSKVRQLALEQELLHLSKLIV